MLASESLYGGQFTLSTQLIKPNYLTIFPPTQHHSFFRNVPPYFVIYRANRICSNVCFWKSCFGHTGELSACRNKCPSTLSGSLMIENLTRSPNCVLMLPKLALSFSIKLVNLVFVFRANCKSPPWLAFWGVHFPRTKPSIEIVSGQMEINVSLSSDPCRRNGPLLPSIFLLRNRSTK